MRRQVLGSLHCGIDMGKIKNNDIFDRVMIAYFTIRVVMNKLFKLLFSDIKIFYCALHQTHCNCWYSIK